MLSCCNGPDRVVSGKKRCLPSLSGQSRTTARVEAERGQRAEGRGEGGGSTSHSESAGRGKRALRTALGSLKRNRAWGVGADPPGGQYETTNASTYKASGNLEEVFCFLTHTDSFEVELP